MAGWEALIPVGYRILKLQIQRVIEHDDVGAGLLKGQVASEDCVQSVGVATFNKT